MRLLRNLLAVNLFLFSCLTSAQGNTNPVSNPNTAAPSTNLKIAVVDIAVFQQRFLTELDSKLQVQFKDRQLEIQKMAKKFQEDQEKLQKDASIMTAKKVEEAKNSLINQQNQLQVEAKKYDEDFNQKRQEELKVKLDTLEKAVANVNTDGKYDMVLAKNVALYVDSKFVITDQVLQAYNDLVTPKTATTNKSASNSKSFFRSNKKT